MLRDLAAEGRTVLLSSHLISEMAVTADHLVVISQGRLLAEMPVTDAASLEEIFITLTSGERRFTESTMRGKK